MMRLGTIRMRGGGVGGIQAAGGEWVLAIVMFVLFTFWLPLTMFYFNNLLKVMPIR